MENSNKEQYGWNFLYSVVFLGLIFAGGMLLVKTFKGHLPVSIKPFDFMLVSLATFRVVRLFVYDKITLFIREPLSRFSSGPLKTAYDLMVCPWCFGVWAGFFIVFLYYYVYQYFWWIILALAISGLASFFQLLANMVGWRAENLKIEAQGKGSQEKSAGSCGVK